MKRISFALVCLTLLFSCGKKGQEEKKQEGLSFGNALSTNRELNETEKSLGMSVCKLFKDKREFFETLEDNKWEFDYEGFEQECGGKRSSLGRFTTRLRVPSRGPIYYDSKFSKYMDELLSDKQGFFSHFCDELLAGKSTNLIQEVGGKKIQVEISSAQNYLIIGSAWYYPDERGVYKAYLIDKAAVHSSATTRNAKLLGVVKERTQSRPCSDGSVKSYQQRLR